MVLIGKKDRLTIVASYVTWREKAEIVMRGSRDVNAIKGNFCGDY